MANTSFDRFAQKYEDSMSEDGDHTHKHTIDPALNEAIGPVKDKVVYDIGCGNGNLSRRLANQGAQEVWASDISEKLIQIAQTKYSNPQNIIKYLVKKATDITNIPDNYFDLVVMNYVVQYIEDFELLAQQLSKILKKGGRFIFTADHPLKNLSRIDIKHPRHNLDKALDLARRYLNRRELVIYNVWTNQEDLATYPSPLSYYVNTLAKYGLLTDRLIEPETKTVRDIGNDQTPVTSTIPTVFALSVKKV